MVNDHRIKMGSEILGLQLIRDDNGVALYNIIEDPPRYEAQLRWRQNEWIGGHGQYDFIRQKELAAYTYTSQDMYFEGQSIDTTQEGRILPGPLIYQVGVSGGDLGANPVCFCWFSAISKLMTAAASKIFWYDGTNFVEKKDITGETVTNLREVGGILYISLGSRTRHEYFTTGGLAGSDIYGTTWESQTFTPSTSHAVKSVWLRLWRNGSPGTLTAGIRATSGGEPTGADLCSGTYDGDTLDATTPAWVEITLGAGTSLTASTKYAIVLRATGGDASNKVLAYTNTTSTYSGGNRLVSADSGSNWTSYGDDNILFEEWEIAAKYYSTADGVNYSQTDLTDGYAEKIFGAPNSAATATVLWKSKNPNELSNTTDGRTAADGGVAWSSPAYIGDTSNDITNIFLVNDNLMVGKTDNLFHYDSDGGVHPLMNDLRHNRSTNNFKYVTEYQTAVYFSLGTGIGEITSYNAYDVIGPLQNTGDLDKVGTCVGLTSDKDWLYPAMDEGTNTIIYKGKKIRRGGDLRWEWCPWVFLGTNTCATAKVCQHSSTDRRLWFGYGNYAGYVILTDNPTADSAARFAPSGFLRMSYIYGTDKYWDKLFQSIVTETANCASGRTWTPKYRKDTDTTATVLTPAITKNGLINTNLSNELDCKRIQFELHFATNDSTEAPEVLFFEARGVEKPETVRVHEATYMIGDTPSRRAKTIRDFLRSARDSDKLIKFADLRYGQSIDKDYTWVVMQPGYPQEIEVLHEKGRQPERGLKCRWQEVSFSK